MKGTIIYLGVHIICNVTVGLCLLDFARGSLVGMATYSFTGTLVTSSVGLIIFPAYFFVFKDSLAKYFMLKILRINESQDIQAIKAEGKVFTKVSSTFYNSTKLEIKKAIMKRKMIGNFLEDLNKEAIIPFTPSQHVRISPFEKSLGLRNSAFQNDVTAKNRIPRLQSMHDILKKPQNSKATQNPILEKAPTPKESNFPSRRNSASPVTSPQAARISGGTRSPAVTIGSVIRLQKSSEAKTTSNFSGLMQQRLKLVKKAKETINSKLKEVNECSICSVSTPDCIFEPCNHGGVCSECAIKCFSQESRQCPICRQVVYCNAAYRENLKTSASEG